MFQILFRESPVLAAWGRIGVLLVALLLVSAGPVCAQHTPSKQPSSRDYIREIDKQMKDAEAYDPSLAKYNRLFKSWVFLSIVAGVVVAAAVGLKVVAWLFARMSANTDPEKLALSDPWVRAQLARQKAEGGGPRADPS